MKQITIQDLLPLLRKGWVAMDEDGSWNFFAFRPTPVKKYGIFVRQEIDFDHAPLDMFDIAPFDGDWKDSLMECGDHIACASKKVADIKK